MYQILKIFQGGFIIKHILFTLITVAGIMFLSSKEADAEMYYEVKTGDNLFQIARNYQVDVATLIAGNPGIVDSEYIQAGQTIKIPDANGLPFTVTAYTAGYESTNKHPGDPWYGITASGEIVQENHTIACPQALPFGTKIHIPQLDETYVCEDRGSAITNGRLDIYIEDLQEALEFGVQQLQVKVWTY